MAECVECGESDSLLVDHHVSYEPEETVKLCISCHATVHKSAEHRLQPDDEPELTTIQIRTEQRKQLEKIQEGKEPIRAALDRLIDNNEPVEEFHRSEVRSIVNQEIQKSVPAQFRKQT